MDIQDKIKQLYLSKVSGESDYLYKFYKDMTREIKTFCQLKISQTYQADKIMNNRKTELQDLCILTIDEIERVLHRLEKEVLEGSITPVRGIEGQIKNQTDKKGGSKLSEIIGKWPD